MTHSHGWRQQALKGQNQTLQWLLKPLLSCDHISYPIHILSARVCHLAKSSISVFNRDTVVSMVICSRCFALRRKGRGVKTIFHRSILYRTLCLLLSCHVLLLLPKSPFPLLSPSLLRCQVHLWSLLGGYMHSDVGPFWDGALIIVWGKASMSDGTRELALLWTWEAHYLLKSHLLSSSW